MGTWTARRVTAALAISGGVIALVGNALSPRINGDNVDVYRKIAHSTRFEVAAMIVLFAVLIVTAALVGITRADRDGGDLAHYARLAVVAGGAMGVLQTGVEIFGYRQEARAFAGANDNNVVSAFWATNALDHVNGAMFATWTAILLGAAPMLIGVMQLRRRTTGRLGWAAIIGGAVCLVVGFAALLKSDQSTYDIPFAVGSVIVTIWVMVTGAVMWRRPAQREIDLSEQRSSAEAVSRT